jgi:hypothetical protein
MRKVRMLGKKPPDSVLDDPTSKNNKQQQEHEIRNDGGEGRSLHGYWSCGCLQ